jgi:hypothetical protein
MNENLTVFFKKLSFKKKIDSVDSDHFGMKGEWMGGGGGDFFSTNLSFSSSLSVGVTESSLLAE